MVQEQSDQLSAAYLIIHQGEVKRRVDIWNESTTIGRSRDCDIFLEDIAVHRKQASIVKTPTGYVLRDDHGSGDSFVNGRAIQEVMLHDGDKLLFGNTPLTFCAHEGTRPFQLASSRGRETHLKKALDPNTSTIAKIELGNLRGSIRTFDLLSEMTIGRSRDCSIFLEDLAVSRLHATIRQLPAGDYELEDHQSATGTYVNGHPVMRCQLREGDVVQIGGSRLTFKVLHPS
ncbi:MAG: FHA domain-containing protein [Ktedonobacteraceae bacterium]|nr:FHA domain-containing protein [Ktedonobacteraceae bacterium]